MAAATNGCPMTAIDSYSDDVSEYIRKKLKKKYGKYKPCRVFHAKSIGLVKAELKVEIDEKDDFLKVGLFKEPKTYKAWIRFSNSNSTPGNDFDKAVRGMAIKILGVKNRDASGEDVEGNIQDIILSNSRNYVPPAAPWVLDGVKIILGKWYEKAFGFLNIVAHSFHGIITFMDSVIVTPNVLEEVYYSGTPYAFGKNRAIHWRATPLKTITSVMPTNPGANFLRERLIADLSTEARENVAFALWVQFHESEATEPIDDSSFVWKTPFHKVATITIPKQNLNTAERKEKNQNTTFSPGRTMAEHAPLGSANLLRAKVYDPIAKERLAHPGKFKDQFVK